MSFLELPQKIVLAIIGLIALFAIGLLSTFIPFLGNFLWAAILFILAYLFSKTDVGKTYLYEGKKLKLNLVGIILLPALALIGLTLAGISLSSLFASFASMLHGIGLGSITDPIVANIPVPANAFQEIIVSLISSLLAAFVLTRKVVMKVIK